MHVQAYLNRSVHRHKEGRVSAPACYPYTTVASPCQSGRLSSSFERSLGLSVAMNTAFAVAPACWLGAIY